MNVEELKGRGRRNYLAEMGVTQMNIVGFDKLIICLGVVDEYDSLCDYHIRQLTYKEEIEAICLTILPSCCNSEIGIDYYWKTAQKRSRAGFHVRFSHSWA